MIVKPENFEVLVIGGGNCGLAIATGLKKAGIAYTVFERDNEHDFQHRARDWGMLLHWGTEHLEHLLPEHLRTRIKEPRVDPSYDLTDPVPYINGKTGELLGLIPTPNLTRVSRKKLRKFLTEGENLNINFNKRVRSVSLPDEDTVVVEFEDSTTATGNMIVGCDGSHSKIRDFLVGTEIAKPEVLDLTMFNFAGAKYTAEEAVAIRDYNPIVKLSVHPDLPGAALMAALDTASADPSDWKFQNYTTWWGPPYASDLADPQKRIEFYIERMSHFHGSIRTAALSGVKGAEEREGDQVVLPIYPGQQWAPSMAWDNHGGRVTIAGDAAHSMLPHRGQGLNNALADARYIVDAIVAAVSGDKTLKNAVDAYEAEMKPRGTSEVNLSYDQAVKSRDFATIMDSPIFKVGHSKVEVNAVKS